MRSAHGRSATACATLDIIATVNESFRTAEGVGVGSTLAQAAAAYGEPTLSYNTNDESREYAAFPRLPESIQLRVAPASGTSAYAGAYDTQGEYNQTTQYDPAARVLMVLVRMTPAPPAVPPATQSQSQSRRPAAGVPSES